MLKKTLIICIMMIVSSSIIAKVANLSEDSKILMFTCGPGAELYAGFGHSAFWVSDPANGVDRLYNFGTFDFETPHFYIKFIRGKLNYMLTVTIARRFLTEYDYRKIAVYGQKLDLSLEERQKMYDFLENNCLPENCFYKYDFFYDNCATRIRDVLVNVVDGNIKFNTEDQNISFREMLFPYLKHTPWTKFGINLILGLSSDKKATPWDYMYLPEYMQLEFRNATIEKDGEVRKLVQSETQFIKSRLDFKNNKWDDPVMFFGFLLILISAISFIEVRKGKYFKWFDLTLFITSVVAGLFLLFMWVGTDHAATNYNMNILWLFPGQALFLVAFFLTGKVKSKVLWGAFIYQIIISFIMFVWPQKAEISFMFISLIFAERIFIKNFRK